MIFGLNRTTDETSLEELLHHFSKEKVTSVLVPRMKDEEIDQLATKLMDLLRIHLTHDEYHSLFLEDSHHNHN